MPHDERPEPVPIPDDLDLEALGIEAWRIVAELEHSDYDPPHPEDALIYLHQLRSVSDALRRKERECRGRVAAAKIAHALDQSKAVERRRQMLMPLGWAGDNWAWHVNEKGARCKEVCRCACHRDATPCPCCVWDATAWEPRRLLKAIVQLYAAAQAVGSVLVVGHGDERDWARDVAARAFERVRQLLPETWATAPAAPASGVASNVDPPAGTAT